MLIVVQISLSIFKTTISITELAKINVFNVTCHILILPSIFWTKNLQCSNVILFGIIDPGSVSVKVSNIKYIYIKNIGIVAKDKIINIGNLL